MPIPHKLACLVIKKTATGTILVVRSTTGEEIVINEALKVYASGVPSLVAGKVFSGVTIELPSQMIVHED